MTLHNIYIYIYIYCEQQGRTHHIVPLLHMDFWPCLVSPTHSKIYLFPPQVAGKDALHRTPFACVLLALWAATSYTLKNLLVSCKVKGSDLTCVGSHQYRGTTQNHIKSSQIKCIQNTRFTFQVVS